MVKYTYDAWGNHAVLDANGADITDETHVGNLNPFRYRSYYYDADLELYYLKSRYYDAEIGRFITIDDISVLDTTREYANGINLYAYCFNNPVNATDEDGNMPKWLKWLLGIVAFVAAVIITAVTGGALAPVFIGMGASIVGGGLIQGISSIINGGDFWQGFWEGAADGALWGGVFALASASVGFIKNIGLMRSRGVVIGKGMDRVGFVADQAALAKYTPMKGYNLIKGNAQSGWRVALADKLSVAHNKAWIKRVMRLEKPIYDIGLGTFKTAGKWYGMELMQVSKYFNYFRF